MTKLWLPALIFGWSTASTSAQWSGHSCAVENLEIVLLSRDSRSGEFTVVERLGSSDVPVDQLTEGDFRRRQLLTNDHLLPAATSVGGSAAAGGFALRGRGSGGAPSSSSPSSIVVPGIEAKAKGVGTDRRSLQDDGGFGGMSESSEELFYARECDCHSPQFSVVYCPFTVDTCQAPGWRNSNGQPGCLTYPRGREASRTIFLVATVWFALFLSILIFTPFGRNCGGCVITSCMTECFRTNCWNRKSARRMLEQNPDRARGMIRSNILRRRRQLERRLAAESARNPPPTGVAETGGGSEAAATQQTDTGNHLPVSLALKTRVYRAPRAVKMEAAAATVAASTTPADPDGVSVSAGSVSRSVDTANLSLRPPAILSLVMGRNNPDQQHHDAYAHHRSNQRRNSRGSMVDISGTFDVDQADLDLLHNGGYEPTDNMDGELDNDCTICFAPIMDGDRVGALECTHLFHADCLKTWILRRNCCPLCQSFQLATPQFKGKQEEDAGGHSDLDVGSSGLPAEIAIGDTPPQSTPTVAAIPQENVDENGNDENTTSDDGGDVHLPEVSTRLGPDDA